MLWLNINAPGPQHTSFPGGMEALNVYIQEHLQYPVEARRQGVEGTVKVAFTITEEGVVESPVIINGLGYGCDEEVLRIVNNMPNWTPARKGSKQSSIKVKLPITFSLN